MKLSFAEVVRILASRKHLVYGDLAEKTSQTRQNLTNKMSRDNFRINEMEEIAKALNCTLSVVMIDNETGEKYELA